MGEGEGKTCTRRNEKVERRRGQGCEGVCIKEGDKRGKACLERNDDEKE